MLLLTMIGEEYGVKRPIDDQLIHRVAQGDMEAFHTLYDSTKKSIYGFALSITKNTYDAEDVLQETFLKVYAAAGDYTGQGKPMAWMFTITRNLALSRLRERGRTAALEDAPEAVELSSVQDVEQRLLLQQLLSLLTEEEREIVVLHVAGGLRHREIGEMLGLPLSTVLSKYHRAIKRLAQTAKEEQV